MSSSRCRLIGDQPDDLERALAASGSAGEELLTFFVQNLDDGQCWLFELGVDPLTIGRPAQADMPLSDATVSGRHARLERHPTGLLIKDLRSTNGTFVNEGRVFSQALIQGDVVRCGGVRLRIVVDGVPEPLNQTVRHEETTRIPVMPEQLIEVHQPDGSLSGPARQSLVRKNVSGCGSEPGSGGGAGGGPPGVAASGDELVSWGEEALDEGADAASDGARGAAQEAGDVDGGEVVLVDGGDEGAVLGEEVLGAENEEIGEVARDASSEIGRCLDIDPGGVTGGLGFGAEHKAHSYTSL